MLIPIVLLSIVHAFVPGSPAQAYAASADDLPESAPKFARFQARTIFRGIPAKAVISTAKARQFRTRLREDSRLGPNFAGHYTVVFWGCGSGCAQIAIVNAISGKVIWLPQDWVDIPDEPDVKANRNYRLDSRLLIVTKSRYDARASFTAYFYVMDKGRLRLIKQLESDHSQ
jgi:hypothetical protein